MNGIHGPKIGVSSLDIHGQKIDAEIDIKKPKIYIPGILLDIHGPKLGGEIGLSGVDIHVLK